MAYLFRTKNKQGKLHPRWRFQYTDATGKRKTGTGTTSKTETEKIAAIAQAKEDAIRKGWAKATKSSDKVRDCKTMIEEYLSWGKSQGGRGGRPWSPVHQQSQESKLKYWRERLGLSFMTDLMDCLPRVEKALRELKTAGRKGKTLNNYAGALSAFGAWAKSRGYLDANPMESWEPYDDTPQTKRRAMTPQEIKALLKVCTPKRRLLYETAICTGLRVNELRQLCVKNLSREFGGLWLDASWTKNRKAGKQPLPSWLLDKLIADSKEKNPADLLLEVPRNAALVLERNLKHAGIPKWHNGAKIDFHALRVTYISMLDFVGATVAEGQALARHASPDMTYNVYAKTRNDRLTELAEKIGESVETDPESITIAERKMAVGASYLPDKELNRAGEGNRTLMSSLGS